MAEAEKAAARLREVFKERAAAFREAVTALFGYRWGAMLTASGGNQVTTEQQANVATGMVAYMPRPVCLPLLWHMVTTSYGAAHVVCTGLR